MPLKDPVARKEYGRKRYLENREKILEKSKQNRDHTNKVRRAWAKRTGFYKGKYGPKQREKHAKFLAKNRERINAYLREWFKNHPEYREKNKAYGREWRKANAGKRKALEYKRRAARLQRTPPWLTEEHYKQIEEIYSKCPAGYQVDHIVPLQGKLVSGLHVPWNLQYLTASENARKRHNFKPMVINGPNVAPAEERSLATC